MDFCRRVLDSVWPGRRIGAMRWETPSFVEINMSAEIGGYGSDFSDRDPWVPSPSRLQRRTARRRPTAPGAERPGLAS